MAEDWAIDVRKYAPDASDAVISGIVRHCGIALQSRDASLVSFTDPAETARVRESFCRRKLGLTLDDAELDAAIARVGERMSGDTTRNRVTVYYLLAEMFGKLHLFGSADPAAGPDAGMADTPAPQEPQGDPDGPPVTAAATAAPVPPDPAASATPNPSAPEAFTSAAPVPPDPSAPMGFTTAAPAMAAAAALGGRPAHAHAVARESERDDGGVVGTALVVLGGLAVVIIGAATAGSILGTWEPETPSVVATPAATMAEAPMPAPVAPAIPEGAGVVAQDVNGTPQLSVYFDTASAEVVPDFATAATALKAYVDANPGSVLAVSGYTDPRGDAAFNAELSKDRAQNVAAALAALGIPAAAIDLEKPAETVDTTTSYENARRVDIKVKGS